jgi:uncharacterized membrane protein
MVSGMDWSRWFRHVFATRRALHRAFPPATLDVIERAIVESERGHGAELRFAVENALDPGDVRRDMTPRERALEVFAGLGVWDTESNNGVLIYVLLADQDVEIVADRGYNGRVSREDWQAVCLEMERHFREGRFEEGSIAGVNGVGEIVTRHFPLLEGGKNPDELPNRPTLL